VVYRGFVKRFESLSFALLFGGLALGGVMGSAAANADFTCKSVGAFPTGNACTPLALSPTLWPDVCNPQLQGWTPIQGSFDQLSWQSFSVLNWPVSPTQRGVPDTSKTPGAKDAKGNFLPTVWESYKGLDEVFGVGALSKSDWNDDQPVPSICAQDTGLRVINMTSKSRTPTALGGHAAPGPLQSVNQAVGGPLTDQQGNLVQYEIRINQVMFDDIVAQKAWDKSHDELTCSGAYAKPTCTPFEFSEGAIETKGAWKVLTAAEQASGKFFVRDMLVEIPADPAHKQKASCSQQTMGLVGLHISRKTPQSTLPSPTNSGKNKIPDWAWATFENDYNVPPVGGVIEGQTWSFNNPTCTPIVTAAQCKQAASSGKANADPQYACCQNLLRYGPVGPTGDPWVMKRGPVQVSRVDASPQPTQACNRVWDQTLASTIWNKYFLVATQWPKKADGPPFTPTLEPAFVRNSVIETYMAKWESISTGTQQTNESSCMGCHQYGVDMSFIFSK